jgi:hypothetical protein
MGMLRNALEDASVIAYLSHHPTEAAALTAAQSMIETDPKKAKVSTGEYRQLLQRIGDTALSDAMAKMKELVDALHMYAHPSLFAVTLAQTEEGIATVGYFSAEDLEQAAYMYIAAYQFVEPAVASFVRNTSPEWSTAATNLTRRCATWIAPVNRQRGLPEPPPQLLVEQ